MFVCAAFLSFIHPPAGWFSPNQKRGRRIKQQKKTILTMIYVWLIINSGKIGTRKTTILSLPKKVVKIY
jgi:hypothetical protein